MARLFPWDLSPLTHTITYSKKLWENWIGMQFSAGMSFTQRKPKPWSSLPWRFSPAAKSFGGNTDREFSNRLFPTDWQIELWSQPRRTPSEPPTGGSCKLSWSQPSPRGRWLGKGTESSGKLPRSAGPGFAKLWAGLQKWSKQAGVNREAVVIWLLSLRQAVTEPGSVLYKKSNTKSGTVDWRKAWNPNANCMPLGTDLPCSEM